MKSLTHLLACTLLFVVLQDAQADVRIVRPSGSQGFSEIQSAIDASAHGDTVLVQSGAYPGFEIVDRTISVVADFNARVLIEDTVTVRDLALGRTVLLGGLLLTGLDLDVQSSGGVQQVQDTTVGLHLQNNLGEVRVTGCLISGGAANAPASSLANTLFEGADAALVESCADVLFSNCTLTGGNRDRADQDLGASPESGAGLRIDSSEVTVWDCELVGGDSGEGFFNGGGFGGTACENFGGNLTLATSSLTGGRGGDGDVSITGLGGSGGSCVFTSAGGNSYLSSVETIPGENGVGLGGPLSPVPLFTGQGVVAQDSSLERVLSAPRLAVEGAPLLLTYQGKTGDSFRLFYGFSTRTLFRDSSPLPLLVAKPARLTDGPIGTITDLSGGTTASFDLPDLLPAMGAREIWMQGLVTAADGRRYLTSPVGVTLFNCSSLSPDCNGNSSFDSCDLITGFSEDCLRNGVPDECEPDCDLDGIPDRCEIVIGDSMDCQRNGIPDECEPDCNLDGIPDSCEEDCNGNGISDTCEILSGQSFDLDNNEIPDGCDGPIGIPVYVDDDAAPFGDGSLSAPFSSIRAAIFNSTPGNSIVVADGVYTGSLNRDLFFPDDFDLISENGPANCIIDCEGLDRFLRVRHFATQTGNGRVRGFTIRNGRPSGEQTSQYCGGTISTSFCGGAIELEDAIDFRIDNCVFENSGGSGPDFDVDSGGAISASFCQGLVIENCWFEGNRAFYGGAIVAVHGVENTVEGCHFEENEGDRGSAILGSGQGSRIFESTFESNTAQRMGTLMLSGRATVDSCLFNENVAASRGGGIYVTPGSGTGDAVLISHCVFTGNDAFDGGGLYLTPSFHERLSVDHCLFAGNTAKSGAGLYLEDDALITHCTLVENTASSIGGGLRAVGGSNLELRNSILWDNTSPIGPELYTFEANSLTALYCDIYDFPLTPIEGCVEPWCSTNVSTDPLFVDTDGPDNDPATLLDNDWRLSATSPLIDAGSNDLTVLDLLDLDRDGDRAEPVPLDLDSLPRFINLPNPDTGAGSGPLTDIGAFERQL